MDTEGKIKVDEHYPADADEPSLFHIKKIESIRSNVKFEQCYESSKLIGDGKFGKVYQVREKATGNEFAAKVIRLKQQADRQEVEREVSILTQLRHPRIAQIYDAFYTANNEVVLIMEIVRGGELFDRVADENYVLTELAVVMIICQLCEAIDYIHEQNILHLDIKPENIMCVSQRGNRIKLIDFGLARHYDGTQELRYMAGTPEFAAPEVIKYEQLDYHTDMWSVGVITYILLSGYSPFLGENICETYCNVERGVWDFTEEFDTVSLEAKDFISNLIVYKKEKRMLPKECLAHPWIARHRAKVQNDAILERPAEGPVMNNKQIMRYNAQRKLRRMVIYVRFLIEMNRLRSLLKNRMSQNGQKYFEPLLKMAQEKEQQQSPLSALIAGASKLSTPKQERSKSAEQKDSSQQAPTVEGASGDKSGASTKIKRITVSSSPETRKPPVVVTQKPTVASVAGLLKTTAAEVATTTEKREVKPDVSEEKRNETLTENWKREPSPSEKKKASDPTLKSKASTSLRKRSKTPENRPAEVKKQPVPEVVVTEPPPARRVAAPETTSSSTGESKSVTTSKVITKKPKRSKSPEASSSLTTQPTATSGTGLKKSESSRSLQPSSTSGPLTDETDSKLEKVKWRSLNDKHSGRTEGGATKPPRPTSPSELGRKTAERNKSGSSSADLPLVLTTAASLDDVQKKKKEDEVLSGSLQVKRLSAPEAIVTVPPKKTVLGAPQKSNNGTDRTTPIRMQRFGSSESGDSSKENRISEEKKPTRQGALRKKDKSLEAEVIIAPPPTPIPLTKQQSTSSINTLFRKRMSIDEPKIDAPNGFSPKSRSTKLSEKYGEGKPMIPRPGSIQERLQKLSSNAASPLVMNSFTTARLPTSLAVLENKAESQPGDEPRKGKVLPITTESKTTTTTMTSTSTMSKKASVEKKVQHVSEGKNVQEVERTCTEQDKASISKVTMRKAESLEKPGTTSTLKKNVVKQDSLRSTAEKERIEEQGKDAAKTTRTARSALTKAQDKVTVEETSKVDGKANKLSLAGSTDVTRKIVEKSEVKLDTLGKAAKKTELTSSEKAKTGLDVEKNGEKASVEKLVVTRVKGVKSDLEGEDTAKSKTTTTTPTSRTSAAQKTPEKTKVVEGKVKSLLETEQAEQPATATVQSTLNKAKQENETKKESSKATTPSKPSPKNSETNSVPATVTKTTTVTLGKSEASGKIKKKRAIVSDADAEVKYVPKDDFSFDVLKDKLARRVSTNDAPKEDAPKKECISIPSVSSVRDRLRKFEGKA